MVAAVSGSPVAVETVAAEGREFGGVAFPLAMAPGREGVTLEDLLEHIRAHPAELDAQLLRHGAVLFRGFPTKTAEAFNAVVEAFGYPNLPYVGGAAPRKHIVGTVFTSNESPPQNRIPFHHEMAQVPTYPSKLFFYCDHPAQEGGQTPILPSHEVYRRVKERHPGFVEALVARGVRYTRVLPEQDDNESAIGRGWRSTFNAATREEAEARCAEMGMTWEWLPDGCMKTVSGVLPAVKHYGAKGDLPVWFNSIVAAYTGWEDVRNRPELAVTYGDGELLPREAVLDTAAIMEEVCVDLTWQQGDIILIDNNQTMHARRSFTPPRRVYASLCK